MATSALTTKLQAEYNRRVQLLADDQKALDLKLPTLNQLKTWNDTAYNNFWLEKNGKCNFKLGSCITQWTNPETGETKSASNINSGAGNALYEFVKYSLNDWSNRINSLQPSVTVLQNEIADLNGTGTNSITAAKKALDASIVYDNTKGLSVAEKAIVSKAQNYKTSLTVGVILIIILILVWLWNKYFKNAA